MPNVLISSTKSKSMKCQKSQADKGKPFFPLLATNEGKKSRQKSICSARNEVITYSVPNPPKHRLTGKQTHKQTVNRFKKKTHKKTVNNYALSKKKGGGEEKKEKVPMTSSPQANSPTTCIVNMQRLCRQGTSYFF